MEISGRISIEEGNSEKFEKNWQEEWIQDTSGSGGESRRTQEELESVGWAGVAES